jgi:exodeoxyribonuclease VII small subunit
MDKELTFESAVNRLEAIVESMEKGEIALEKALELFGEGQKLLKFCQGKLNEAEKKLKILEKDQEGLPILKDSDEPEENTDT